MKENLIKSAARVKDLGEVFTPKKIVNFMLDQPEIQAKVQDLTATFLEPAAGEGAFLTELLTRKMKVAQVQSHNAKDYGKNCLIALSTLYGIEIMEDNVEMLVMNMIMTFHDVYNSTVVSKFNASKPDIHVLKSAQIIIKVNISQGDTLKKIMADGSPIIFSEWKLIVGKVKKVERIEYTFDAIINGGSPKEPSQNRYENIDLFADFSEDNMQTKSQDSIPKKKYAIVKWTDIYKEKLE
ncbi:DNA methyltransferase [Bombilactobacillus bombi]|uniref:site-specific DNA-methyltransferase (adenine-specific) n=1 Tax=Bombilactobacillus bombi TaxID=1303590 RepID=A0A417ZCI0_9LACO|nr:N-6 DNA methylase [Bombilactobacillus bombi]RHW48407.1 DNA methyltransferase [Bombilactobacillus bombi]